MFNPFGSAGLLTTNLGGAQSAFHPVHSPTNLSSTSPQSRTSSSATYFRGSPVEDYKTLSILRPLTPPSSEGAPSTTVSPSLFNFSAKRSPQWESNESRSLGQCQICGDRATGKHYGADSCDGCKGFFRRTIRKHQHYACRFDRSCVIDKDKRNTCRFCRFKKCLNAGMRRDAVQNERDRISVKPMGRAASRTPKNSPEPRTEPSTEDVYLGLIQQTESLYARLRASVLAPNNSPVKAELNASTRLATLNDLAEAIKQQLLLLVEWAKSLPPFYDLALEDQVSLLRAYAAEHLLLGVARRSLPYKDVLLLSNDACISRLHSSEVHDVNRVTFRILDELVEPLRELQLDDTEYGCLKALLFFNPSALGLTSRRKVKETRQNFLQAFNDYVSRNKFSDKVRFGNLLLLLPPLRAISQQFIEDLQLVSLFGVATIDKLLEELLLASAEPLAPPFLTGGFNAVATKMAGVIKNGPGSPHSGGGVN